MHSDPRTARFTCCARGWGLEMSKTNINPALMEFTVQLEWEDRSLKKKLYKLLYRYMQS